MHYALAQMLRRDGEGNNRAEVGQHLRRSFSVGGNRYEARLYFARHEYLYGDRALARREFNELSWVPLPPNELSEIRGIIRDPKRDFIRYTGEVTQKRDGYCFVRCHALNSHVFMHASQLDRAAWASLSPGQTVTFRVGFNLKGV